MNASYSKTIVFTVLLGLVVGILLELFVFNFTYFSNKMMLPSSTNVEVSEEDITYINWEERDETRLSLPDPMIVVERADIKVIEMTLFLGMDKDAEDSRIFYTTEDGETFGAEKMLELSLCAGTNRVKLNSFIHDLRIDPGEDAGMELKSFALTFNENSLDFSISRVVVVLIIIAVGRLLFLLQEGPHYEVE